MANSNGDGMATTRLSGTERASAERLSVAADAAAYLIRKGHHDLLEVLGLDDSAPGWRRCSAPGCDQPILSTATGGKQRCCSRACASRKAAAERTANRHERTSKAKGNV